jgi:YegS/Rv2252/BmrU family lipid kinase
MDHPFAIILNAGSGSKQVEEKFHLLKDAFIKESIDPEIFLAHGAAGLAESTQKAILKGYELVVAAGGDGTVSAVANEVIKAKVTLGILPLGTLNHLAKDIGIPLELEKAIKVLILGKTITIDAAQVNDRIFVNNSSIGLYANLVRFRERYQNLGQSKISAFIRALVNLPYGFFRVLIEINGKEIDLKTPFVFIGNNEYKIEGSNIGTREKINANKLSVYVAHHVGKFGILILGWHALFGGLAEHKDFDVYNCSSVTINTEKKILNVSVDGEVISVPSPLFYKILPQILKVKVL